jgi:hypothetical protein
MEGTCVAGEDVRRKRIQNNLRSQYLTLDGRAMVLFRPAPPLLPTFNVGVKIDFPIFSPYFSPSPGPTLNMGEGRGR